MVYGHTPVELLIAQIAKKEKTNADFLQKIVQNFTVFILDYEW